MVRTTVQTPPYWDKYSPVAESSEMEHISDADITDGGMGFEFPSLQRWLEWLCFDINRNTDCISKMEDSFTQPEHTLSIY